MNTCCEATPDASAASENQLARARRQVGTLLRNGQPSFLLGAGCSVSAGLPLVNELAGRVLEDAEVRDPTKIALRAVIQEFESDTDERSAHIEDYLSELVDLRSIATRRQTRGNSGSSVDIGSKGYSASSLADIIEDISHAIVRSVDVDLTEDKLDVHRLFVRTIHQPIRDGRSERAKPVSYIVLNYDTLIETSLAYERIKYADGLDGGTTAWWDLEVFRQPSLRARVYKIHGSIDWRESVDDPLRFPRRTLTSTSSEPNNNGRVMIWPAETKYRETRQDPFAQLAEQAWYSLRQASDAPSILLTCGYSFGDAHINEEITRCLREIPDLTLIVLIGACCPARVPELAKWQDDPVLGPRILIYSQHGFYHAPESIVSNAPLDWWKFENLVSLIEEA